MMKLGNIKIATMLLLAVFIYDIFFVFITPLFLDGQSIMITVARGGAGESTADDFCFKYPEHKDCTGIDFLPMLLILPRVNDYQQGSALLGLGDIVRKCATRILRRLFASLLTSFIFNVPQCPAT